MPSLALSGDGCRVGQIPQSVVEEWTVEMARKIMYPSHLSGPRAQTVTPTAESTLETQGGIN